MDQSQDGLLQDILEASEYLQNRMDEARKRGYDISSLYFAHHYIPHEIVKDLIDEIDCFFNKNKPTKKQRQDAGYKLEELALATFSSLKGWSSVKSYQSANAQYDLLLSGEGPEWENALSLLPLKLPQHTTSIVVEAKATKRKVNDAQFARLCSLMHTNLDTTSVIGVFFTLKGASGFSTRDGKSPRNIGNARLRQLMFYAKTGKPIVVFDIHDIRTLSRNGSLLKLISHKIKDIEELTGLPTHLENWNEVLLPSKLQELHDKLHA